MQTTLQRLDKIDGIGDSRAAAAILGVCYSNYMAMKAGTRPTPRYVEWHAEAIMALAPDVRARLLRKRLKHA